MVIPVLTFSQEISVKEAQIFALTFISNQNKSINYEIERVEGRNFNSHKTCYIVQFSPSGFVILSAQKNYKPILAYSTFSNFAFENSPPAVDLFLKQYNYTIDSLLKNNNKSNNYSTKWEQISNTNNKANIIEPLLKSNWGQDRNFDSKCGTITDSLYSAYNKYIPSASPTNN